MDIGFNLKFKEDGHIPVNEFGLFHSVASHDFSVYLKKNKDFGIGYKSANDGYAFVANYGDSIGFGGLPLVGDIPLINEVSIGHMLLTAASADGALPPFEIQGLDIKKGIYFLAELHIPGQVIDIVIPVSKDTPEHSAYDANDFALDAISENNWSEIKIDKAIGPCMLKVLRFSMTNGQIRLGLDAAFVVAGISFGMDGLAISYDTKKRAVGFEILGLSLDVNTDALQIAGSFIKKDEYTYAGALLMRISQITIMAIGSYKSAGPELPVDSVFAFALLKGQIGGPPCFFITGFAIGFGYNRCLSIPNIDQLTSFPLLKAAEGSISGADLLESEKTYFKPQADKSWVAAGVLFNSFKMIDSVAILTASWGSDVEINLIGRSVLNIPFNSNSTPIAHAVLLLKASFKPSQSLIAVDAKLSSESYIISKDCQLTGGFAFYTWYGGEYAGDFVLTLGGYHPRYSKPAHYPQVDRLGFNWRISQDLSAWGGIYFALTPSCIMAGGSLHLRFSKGIVEAWFDAYMDMYMQWKPYHYDIAIGISIGCKVDLWLCTVRLELGCDLHIWGPEFSGNALVKLWCIRFTISFGAGSSQAPPPISQGEFISSFLPKPEMAARNAENASPLFGGCTVSLNRGLLADHNTESNQSQSEPRKVCADQLEFTVKSVIPCHKIILNKAVVFNSSNSLYLRPCQATLNLSELTISFMLKVKDQSGNDMLINVEKERLNSAIITENLPSALWGAPNGKNESISAVTGLAIRINPLPRYELQIPTLRDKSERQQNLDKPPILRLAQYDQKNAYAEIAKIRVTSTAKARDAILTAIGDGWNDIDLSDLAKDPKSFFCSAPILASIGG